MREYDTGCEAVCVEADPNLDLSDRSKIVIGCTDLINEPAIKLAAYLYNSSQDEYMAVIEEYKMDYNDLDQSRVELLRMFNEGNTPDIICSNYRSVENRKLYNKTQRLVFYLFEKNTKGRVVAEKENKEKIGFRLGNKHE